MSNNINLLLEDVTLVDFYLPFIYYTTGDLVDFIYPVFIAGQVRVMEGDPGLGCVPCGTCDVKRAQLCPFVCWILQRRSGTHSPLHAQNRFHLYFGYPCADQRF